MTVFSKRSYVFSSGEASGQQRFLLKAGSTPQEAPDWIRGTRLFQLAVADGNLYELVKPEVEQDSEKPSQPKAKKQPPQFKQPQ